MVLPPCEFSKRSSRISLGSSARLPSSPCPLLSSPSPQPKAPYTFPLRFSLGWYLQSPVPAPYSPSHLLPLLLSLPPLPQDCSNTLWALARLGLRPPESWMAVFVEESFTQLPRFTSQHMANTVWAFAKLGRKPPEPWMDRWARAGRGGASRSCEERSDQVPTWGAFGQFGGRGWVLQLRERESERDCDVRVCAHVFVFVSACHITGMQSRRCAAALMKFARKGSTVASGLAGRAEAAIIPMDPSEPRASTAYPRTHSTHAPTADVAL